MAIPFYNQIDQDIYTGGEHFIPQQDYRLNYTPSTALANTVGGTGGVTGTQAAIPYIWPPQGGGGGGGDNYFGPNATTKMFSKNVYDADTGTWNMQDIKGYWTPSGYKTKDEKNIEHAGWLTGDPKEGDIEATEMDFSSFPSPINFITTKLRNWKKNREIKKAEDNEAAIAAHNQAAADEVRGLQVQRNIDTYGNADRPDTGMNAPGEGKGQSPTGGNVSGTPFAQGGRIGLYAGGDPEEPAENLFEFMRDQNIPLSEQVEGEEGILQQLIAKYIEEGFPPDQAEEMAMLEFQEMAMGSEQGIASLV